MIEASQLSHEINILILILQIKDKPSLEIRELALIITSLSYSRTLAPCTTPQVILEKA